MVLLGLPGKPGFLVIGLYSLIKVPGLKKHSTLRQIAVNQIYKTGFVCLSP